MELPLTPARPPGPRAAALPRPGGRRSRANERWTYGEFADRCDRLGPRAPARPRRAARPGRRLAVRQHPRAARGVLRRAAGGRRAAAAQHPAGAGRAARHPRRQRRGRAVPPPGPARSRARRPDRASSATEHEALLARPARRTRCPRPPVDEHAAGRALLHVGLDRHAEGRAAQPPRALPPRRSTARSTMGLTGDDVFLHTIPLFHVNGWGTPHFVTGLGGVHVMLPRFDAGEVLRLVEAHRVTRLFLVPAMARLVLDHPSPAEPRPVERAPDLGRAARRPVRRPARRARGRLRVRGASAATA